MPDSAARIPSQRNSTIRRHGFTDFTPNPARPNIGYRAEYEDTFSAGQPNKVSRRYLSPQETRARFYAMQNYQKTGLSQYQNPTKQRSDISLNRNYNTLKTQNYTWQISYPTKNGKRDLDHVTGFTAKDKQGHTLADIQFTRDSKGQITGGTIKEKDGKIRQIPKEKAQRLGNQLTNALNTKRQKQEYQKMSKDTSRYSVKKDSRRSLTAFTDKQTGKQYLFSGSGKNTRLLATYAKGKDGNNTLRFYNHGKNVRTYSGTPKVISGQLKMDFSHKSKQQHLNKTQPHKLNKAALKPMARSIGR